MSSTYCGQRCGPLFIFEGLHTALCPEASLQLIFKCFSINSDSFTQKVDPREGEMSI